MKTAILLSPVFANRTAGSNLEHSAWFYWTSWINDLISLL